MGLKSKVWTIAVVLSALMLVPSSGVAQATSLRATPSQHEASARLYGVRDQTATARDDGRPKMRSTAKAAWIGGAVGGALGTLFVFAFTGGRDGGGSPIDGNGPLFIVGGAAVGALIGAVIGAGSD